MNFTAYGLDADDHRSADMPEKEVSTLESNEHLDVEQDSTVTTQ